jgi:predicted metal-dependent hydrolase
MHLLKCHDIGMQQALINFYYQFHTKQHYFLCHDILEDAWKAENNYSKHEIDNRNLSVPVAFCYHPNLKVSYFHAIIF